MNDFSWTQNWSGIKTFAPTERIAAVEGALRDFNVGTQKLRFKVIDVKPVGDDIYRIKLKASQAAIERITGIWAGSQYYTVNGKRRMTHE